MPRPWIKAALATLAIFTLASAHPSPRSSKAKRAFASSTPCPATGEPIPHCPGWQIDHIVPLCAGGQDAPCNMQWLTIKQHKDKTRKDFQDCLVR